MTKWLAANKLVLHLDERKIFDFTAKNSVYSILRVGYTENYIKETANTIFHGLQIDNHLNWKNDIERIIPKLSEEFYAVRLMVHISNMNTFKSIYYKHFLSIIQIRKIFR